MAHLEKERVVRAACVAIRNLVARRWGSMHISEFGFGLSDSRSAATLWILCLSWVLKDR
jgi:hypothetical protein